MGRKPKPTALKKLDGRPGRLGINEREPPTESTAPDCPPELSKSAKAEWKRIVAELASMGLLARADRAAIAGYCIVQAGVFELERELDKQTYGRLGLDYAGARRLLNTYLQTSRSYLSEFGLSPASRAKVSSSDAGAKKEEDDFEAFQAGELKLHA